MKTIFLKFDSLKFIPVQNSTGGLFAFNVDNFPYTLDDSPDSTTFTCYSIELDGNLALTGKEYFFQKEELFPIGVKVMNH